MFNYGKTESDITIVFGEQYINERIYGYNDITKKKVFLCNVRTDGKIVIQLKIFNNFSWLQFEDKKIELKK